MYRKLKKSCHKCKPARCVHCREPITQADTEHKCFIQPVKKKKPNDKYMFYDFETRFENGKHEANFICAMDFQGEKFCYNTSKCVSAFIKHYSRATYRGYTFIAHNASGFDSYLVLEYFVKQRIVPTVTMRGSRVIIMHDDGYDQRWIDSFSFLPMSLAKTPAALGFEDLEKGYFPHKFNTKANEFYIGPYPDPSFYSYDAMTPAAKAKFMEWYQPAHTNRFDFQREIRKYCVNDMEVL